MTITVACSCGTRVRAEQHRLRRKPPCPNCGAALPDRPEPKEKRRIPLRCICGLEMTFPWSRGGLWFDCPQCGRKSVIPGRGASVSRPLPVNLPPEIAAAKRRSLVPLLLFLGVAAMAAAIAFVLFR